LKSQIEHSRVGSSLEKNKEEKEEKKKFK